MHFGKKFKLIEEEVKFGTKMRSSEFFKPITGKCSANVFDILTSICSAPDPLANVANG
jgi:hypothetical protein